MKQTGYISMKFCSKHTVDIRPHRCPFCRLEELETLLREISDEAKQHGSFIWIFETIDEAIKGEG